MPIFGYKAIADELSLVEDWDALISRYCGRGVDILYQRNAVGGHEDEATNTDGAFSWLNDALAGRYLLQEGCTIQNSPQGALD